MNVGVIITDIIDVWDCGNNGCWEIIAEIMDILWIIITEVMDIGDNYCRIMDVEDNYCEVMDVGDNYCRSNGCWEWELWK
ncbi:hypothetical protein Glove_365g58 [Diversispora epigaea]|uniref:Uncharacterized protein n=1 Tax=Diversispora epigaea TaxID=1348612 RepID=A0A397HCW6_9GLOM|nr:hypothetical protein Glove_365g58 [Diversispora epigaea]